MAALQEMDQMEVSDPPLDAIEEAGRMFDQSQIPSTEAMRELAKLAAELVRTDSLVSQTQELLDSLKAKRHQLVTKSLPDLFDRCMTDKIGLPEESCDVVVENRYHAAIKADWPDEQRDAAFSELERVELGDLIKCQLTVTFGKGELEAARRVAEHLRAWNEFGNRPIAIRQEVAWNTLTAAVKTEIEAGNRRLLDLGKIGATAGREARIVRRRRL